MRAGVRLRISARGVALRAGGGRLVGGCDTALGGCDAVKVNYCVRVVSRYVKLLPANFFQHFGIDIATANDGNIEFGLRKLIATE